MIRTLKLSLEDLKKVFNRPEYLTDFVRRTITIPMKNSYKIVIV